MVYPVEKAKDAGAVDVWLTERGNMYGYNNLVVDFRNISDMLDIVPTVIMDCTHSVQRPGGGGGKILATDVSCRQWLLLPRLLVQPDTFFEVHPDPDKALSDGPNMLCIDDLEKVIESICK